MRRIKSSFNDPFSLGCICLYLASAINGYILRVDQSNDLEETKAFDDGRVPHKRTFGGIEEGFEEDVDGGAAGGDVGHSDGGSGRYVSFAEAPPKFIEARKHGKVLLECSAKGEPAPQIRWYKDGKPLHKVINNQPSQRYFQTTFFSKDYGRSGLKMRSTQQNIFFSLQNKKHPKKMFNHHGMPLYRYGKGMLHKDLKMAGSLGQIKAQVNLDCLTEEDAGVYECVIWNGYETKTTTTELRVESKLMDLICIVYTFI